MVIHFTQNLPKALQEIQFFEYRGFVVHEKEEIRTYLNSDELVSKYGDSKWAVIDLLNERYNSSFDLHNWVNKNEDDEVAYFINEAGSNCLNYSQFKIPHKFHLWLGKKGFVLGVEQKGVGFNAEEIHHQKLKDNEGAAFDFFRNCQSKVFFDNSENARIVFMIFLG